MVYDEEEVKLAIRDSYVMGALVGIVGTLLLVITTWLWVHW